MFNQNKYYVQSSTNITELTDNSKCLIEDIYPHYVTFQKCKIEGKEFKTIKGVTLFKVRP